MLSLPRSTWPRYGLAVASVVVAVAIRLALDPVLGDLFPFATLFFAVLIVAGYAGHGPALLATGLGAVLSARFLLPPRDSLTVRGVENQAGLALYLVVGLGIALFGGALRDARKRARRDADEAVQQREQLRITLASIGDAVLVTDAEGRVRSLNPVAEALTGWTSQEAAGQPLPAVFSIVNEETRREVENPALRALREGVIVGMANHTILISKDGMERPIDDSAAPIRDDRGRVSGVVLTFRDVTARRRQENLLREGEQRTRSILESITDAFFAVDRAWRFTYVNRQAERVLDRRPGDLLGKVLWDEYPGLAGSEFERAYRRADDERVAVSFTSYYPDHDRWYEVYCYPAPDGLSVYFRDVTGRVRAEERERRLLAASERLRRTYETALSNTPDFNYIFDLDGRFTYVNAALLGLWRKGLDEAVGRDFFDLGYPPELAARLQRQIRQVIDTRQPVRDDTPYTSHLGERMYEYIFVPVLGAGGEVEAVAGSTRDITERKRAEEALRRGEERLRLIVESAADYAIFTLDLDGKVATWNSGARNLLGYEEQEIVGRDGSILFIPEDIERGVPEQEIEKALDRGRAENERWHVRNDGTRFWASGLLMPMRDGGGAVGLLKIMRDTTEQKRTEQELEVSRERLDLVVNSSEVGLWYCDLPFDGLVWNPKCKEHFGLAPDAEVTIDTFYERIHPEDREVTRRAIERSIGDRSEYDAEFRTVDPQGRVRWVRAIGQPFYDVEGTPLRFDGITVDVTGRIEQEQALREADRRKDEFLATLAHELRNPLAPIRNALHLMRRPDGDGEMESERAMAERQVTHLARLIDDLMDVARISQGKIDLHREAVDLATIVSQSVETARPQIDDRRHRLTVSLPGEAIRLEADPTRLEQVLWNLLNNSAKYTEPGGEITLTVEPDGGEAVLRVQDTGIGIRPEMLPNVFDMFVQVDDHKGHSQGGLGIGLSLVRTLVEMHGGSIAAHSEGPGMGSEFVVRLPILARAKGKDTQARGHHGGPADRPPSRRILVVDDNVDAARSLARLLARLYDQEVRVAHDGPEALAIAGEFLPEVVLLDIGLPGMDGNEVARRLRLRPEFRRALLVALTGWGQEDDVARSKEAGFDHHLVKPADPDALKGLLEGWQADPD